MCALLVTECCSDSCKIGTVGFRLNHFVIKENKCKVSIL